MAFSESISLLQKIISLYKCISCLIIMRKFIVIGGIKGVI